MRNAKMLGLIALVFVVGSGLWGQARKGKAPAKPKAKGAVAAAPAAPGPQKMDCRTLALLLNLWTICRHRTRFLLL